MTSLTIIRWRFGPRLNCVSRYRAVLRRDAPHVECWRTATDCVAPDCVMGRFDGRPERIEVSR